MPRRHTPYYHKLVALGAELVDRIGYDAALRFTTVAEEHLATRERVGVYDVYHQGALDLKGPDAEALLSRLLVNDPARLDDGGVLYSSLCNEAGGMVDDLTVYRLAGDHFWLCPTPSRVDTVDAWIRDHIDGRRAYLTNIVSGTAFLSLQGPRSRETLAAMTDLDLSTDGLAVLPLHARRRGRGPDARRPHRATRASSATSCSSRASTPSTCGMPRSPPASRSGSRRAASGPCGPSGWRRSTRSMDWT